MQNYILDSINLDAGGKVYFIGISGISMSGLAELALHIGFEVAGSDPRDSEQVKRLKALGIKIFNEQVAENIISLKPDLVVYSSAIPDTNPELLQARKDNILSVSRAQFLGSLTRKYNKVINVAGTHGKSTTTSMISLILMEAELDPTVHLGADFEYFNNNTIRLGSNELLVSEADEYKRSFLNFASTTSIILNIDEDHLDFYKDLDDIINSFATFADNLADNGTLIIPEDTPNKTKFLELLQEKRKLANRSMPKIITYGEYQAESDHQADYYFKNLELINGHPNYEVYKNNELYGRFTLAVPGIHNISNSLAAIIAAEVNGADLDSAIRALKKFHGAGGRFDLFGKFKGADVIADYAHHPREVEVTLAAANTMPHEKVWPVCQILNYSRARDYHEEFIDLFQDYPFVVYYTIYSSRETDKLGQSAERLAREFNERYPNNEAVACNTVDELIETFKSRVNADDMILFLGPEGIRAAAVEFCKSDLAEYFK